ncbi:MAG: type II toxin-antitoxin system HicB family antitoxin [Patescibacteria group bacterium]
MKTLNYSVVFKLETEGGYTAIVPSLPGCVTYGKTLEEAKKYTKEAIQSYLASLKKHSEEIPTEENVLVGNINIDYKIQPSYL